MVDVIPISTILAPNLLHHNNVGVSYVGTFNFKMELIKFVPLYFVAMLKFMITIIETPFTTTKGNLIHQVISLDFE